MRRFFCQQIPAVNQTVELAGDEAKHLRTVLRHARGAVELLDGNGTRATAELLADDNRRRARLRLTTRQSIPRPPLRFHLYVAPPRSKQMSQIVRQATELGVTAIRPIITERSVADPKASSTAWLAQAREAIKQSGNPWLPELHPPTNFTDALATAPPGWLGIPNYLDAQPGQCDPVTSPDQAIWIGPEGGFSDAEHAALATITAPLAIGDWVLRVETAVVAVIAAAHRANTPRSTL